MAPIHLKPLQAAAPVRGPTSMEMVVDISRTGALSGVEPLSPEHVTLKGINRALKKYRVTPLERVDWKPSRS